MITEGKMQYLFDERGRRYLDVSPTLCHSAWSSLLHAVQQAC